MHGRLEVAIRLSLGADWWWWWKPEAHENLTTPFDSILLSSSGIMIGNRVCNKYLKGVDLKKKLQIIQTISYLHALLSYAFIYRQFLTRFSTFIPVASSHR